jgi:hypothetical protein
MIYNNYLVDSGLWINETTIDFRIYYNNQFKPIAIIEYTGGNLDTTHLNLDRVMPKKNYYNIKYKNINLSDEQINNIVKEKYPRLIYLVLSGNYNQAKIEFKSPIQSNNKIDNTILILLFMYLLT